MNASSTEYFRPPYAVTCWADAYDVYVEVPFGTTPYILRFPLTEAGLSKALKVLKDLRPAPPIGSARFSLPSRKILPPPKARRPTKPALSPERKASVMALLRKNGRGEP